MEIDTQAMPALAVMQQYNDAFNRHDVNTIMQLMTADCVFENSFPAPNGEVYQGQTAVRGYWERFFVASPQASFEFYDQFVCYDRAVVHFTYRWIDKYGRKGHVQGVDILRLRDGKIAEKQTYVKG